MNEPVCLTTNDVLNFCKEQQKIKDEVLEIKNSLFKIDERFDVFDSNFAKFRSDHGDDIAALRACYESLADRQRINNQKLYWIGGTFLFCLQAFWWSINNIHSLISFVEASKIIK